GVVVADDLDDRVRTRLGVAGATLDLDLDVLVLDRVDAGFGDVLVVDLHELDLAGAEAQTEGAAEAAVAEGHGARHAEADGVVADGDLATDDVARVQLRDTVGRGVVGTRVAGGAVGRAGLAFRRDSDVGGGVTGDPDHASGAVGSQRRRDDGGFSGAGDGDARSHLLA